MSSPGGSKAEAPTDGPVPRTRGAARRAPDAAPTSTSEVFSIVLANAAARAALAGIVECDISTSVQLVPTTIDMAARDAVRLTCRHWRREFDAGVTKIRFNDDELSYVSDWQRLGCMQWPQLQRAGFFNVDPVPRLPARLRLEFPALEELDAFLGCSLDLLGNLRRCRLPALHKLKVNLHKSPSAFENLCALDLPQLKVIELHGLCNLTAERAARLAATNWALVEKLELSPDGVTAEAVAVLGTAPWAPSLAALWIKSCNFGAAHAAELQKLALPLREINLCHNPALGPAGVSELCRGRWPFLRRLQLDNCGLTADALESIVAAPWASRLDFLSIGNNPFPGSALQALQRRAWPELKTLDVGDCNLAGAGVEALAGCRFSALEVLRICKTGVGRSPDDIRCLQGLERLKELHLGFNVHGLSAGFFKALCTTPFPRLTRLTLHYSPLEVSPAEAGELLCRATWQLEALDLEDCFLSGQGLPALEAALRARWPAAQFAFVSPYQSSLAAIFAALVGNANENDSEDGEDDSEDDEEDVGEDGGNDA